KLALEDLLRYLKKMPANYFEVFNLYVLDGYSHEEIAQMLDIEPALSRKRLSRARMWLNDRFSSNCANFMELFTNN
ncbi:MAG: sigma-70 region 4 domain-containing protein, partial [Saprospiraceae bacterium]|nr:sigma-70 region 4 domain-containing protein [Saprospiraceae bacterium]